MKSEIYWVKFYKEFANELIKYKNKRKDIIETIKRIFKNIETIDLPTLEKDNNIVDIDPFTVFGLFNKRSLTRENRIKIISGFAKEFKLQTKIPTEFDGIPTLDNRNATFYAFADERKEDDIDNLWNLFEAAITYIKDRNEDNIEKFSKYFDIAVGMKYNAYGKITMGLYWIAADFFLTLESRTKWYIYQSNKISKSIISELPEIKNGMSSKDYLNIIEKIQKGINNGEIKAKDFVDLSYKAWEYSNEVNNQTKEKNVKNNIEKNKNIIEGNSKPENRIGQNLIVYGVPGSGKSYYIENILLKGEDKEKYVKRVTFYPEYTYYDFIGQMIPKKNGKGLEPAKGPFTRILEKALEAEKNKKGEHFYLIIEELNRGNAEAIFGDIFQLLDRDENGRSRYSIDNQFIAEALNLESEKIYLPSNLSIYATINNADQNVFNMDTAFGRRWNYELKPCNVEKNTEENEDNKIFFEGYIKGTNIEWNKLRNIINIKIIEEKNAIFNAEEKRIGLYYIDKQLLKMPSDKINPEENKRYREKFANKIFRYLYLNVFKNDLGLIFKKANEKTLEDYTSDFKKEGDITKILIGLGDENESRD